MNMKKVVILLLILLLLPFTLKFKSQDFGRGQSLFTDIKAHQVGDILTVFIYEDSRASNKVEAKQSKDQDVSMSGGPGYGPFDFIPLFGFDASSKYSHDGKGEQLRNGKISAKMSVTVVGLKDNGDLIIEGTRVIGISNDKETITLSGVVRSKDVSTENSIESYLIADAEIHYTGKGNSQNSARPGIIARVLGWLF